MRVLKGRAPESPDQLVGCTHLVVYTGQPLRRSLKLLLALSTPTCQVVTEGWIKACEMARAFVDAKPFLLHGVHRSEKLGWEFDADESRRRLAELASKGGCLADGVARNASFYLTEWKGKAAPQQRCVDAQVKLLVRAAGGTLLDAPPGPAERGTTIVISTEEEKPAWQRLARQRNVVVLSFNHVITCLLQQKLTLDGKLEA